jgi:hypothetical protein
MNEAIGEDTVAKTRDFVRPMCTLLNAMTACEPWPHMVPAAPAVAPASTTHRRPSRRRMRPSRAARR